MSVNLSCKQFSQSNLVENIQKTISETNVNPFNLKLEITESVVMEYQEKAVEMLNQFTKLGVEIYIDDFGTGYSNLNYLMQLPISTLKIDHSFIKPLNTNEKSIEIVDVIIKLALSLGMKIIAEGVENAQQIEKLKALSCESFQGNFYSKPMSGEKLLKFLENQDMTKIIDIQPYSNISELPVVQ